MTVEPAEVEAAGGVVVDHAGRDAAVYRPHRLDWSLPKGHLEERETHEQAARREVQEETGFDCRIVGDAGETRYLDRRGRRKRVRYYLMRVSGGEFSPNDEVSRLEWLSIDELDRLTWPADREIAHAAIRTAGTAGGHREGRREGQRDE